MPNFDMTIKLDLSSYATSAQEFTDYKNTNYLCWHTDMPNRLYAGMLMLCGVPLISAADRSGVKRSSLCSLAAYVEAIDPIGRLHPSLSFPQSKWLRYLPTIAKWASTHFYEIVRLAGNTNVLRYRSHNIEVRDAEALFEFEKLWHDLSTIDVVVIFSPARSLGISYRAYLEHNLLKNGIIIGPTVSRESIGRLSFSLRDQSDCNRVVRSGHVVGKTNALVFHTMSMVVMLNSSEVT